MKCNSALNAVSRPSDSDRRLGQLTELFWNWRLFESPEYGTKYGMNEYDDRVEEITEQAFRRKKVLYSKLAYVRTYEMYVCVCVCVCVCVRARARAAVCAYMRGGAKDDIPCLCISGQCNGPVTRGERYRRVNVDVNEQDQPEDTQRPSQRVHFWLRFQEVSDQPFKI